MIGISAALLFVWLAAAFSCLRNTRCCREHQMCNSKNNHSPKVASDRPVSNAIEHIRVSCIASSSAIRNKTLYKHHYCEPWEVTSSV